MGLTVQHHYKNLPVNVFRKIIAVDCESCAEHINTPHVHTASVNILASGAYS